MDHTGMNTTNHFTKETFNYKKNLFEKKFEEQIINEIYLNKLSNSNKFDKDKLLKKSLSTFLSLEIEEQFNLGFYNIAKKRSKLFCNNYHLHKAIFDNNIKKINDICKNESKENLFCHINEIDHMGNSPLLLAIKLNRLDAIKVLCDNNAEIKHYAYDDAITPYDYAIISKNTNVLKILVNAFKKQKLSLWHQSQKELADVIKKIPDFSMVFTVSLNSTIFSVIKSITPQDVFKISKKNSNIRIDMNISSLNTALKAFKGKSSFVIKEKNNNITITKIDHQKKISFDYIDSISEIKEDQQKVEELIADGWKTKKLNGINIKMQSQSNKKKDEKILSYESQNIIAKGFICWMKRKLNKKNFEELCNNEKKAFDVLFKTFKDYINVDNVNKNENLEIIFNKEINFYAPKFIKVINFALSHESNIDNITANIKNVQNNFNVKFTNPLLFSFENNNKNNNKNNEIEYCANIPTPVKYLNETNESHGFIDNKKNDYNQEDYEDKTLFLINIFRKYSFNLLLKEIFEKTIKENGLLNDNFEEEKDVNDKSTIQLYLNTNKINNSNLLLDTKNKLTINSFDRKNEITLIPQSYPNDNNHSKLTNINNESKQNSSSFVNSIAKANKPKRAESQLNKTLKANDENLINKKISQKEISLSLLTSKDFPIKIFHFIPLIHILSFTSSEFTQLNSLLSSNFLPYDSFPLKINFPLGLSLNACLIVTEFKSDIIQDISISDFNVDNNNLNTNLTSNGYCKDLSSNANYSTALLDDKYAKDFYDKYFQEKKIGVFSEFSEESFDKDNFLKGSKTNYSDLFRDEESPLNNDLNNNNNINDLSNKDFLLTELVKEEEKEELFFKNKIWKKSKNNFANMKSNKYNSTYKNSNDNYVCFESALNKERETSRENREHTENSVSKRDYSIATKNYKNKKIGLNSKNIKNFSDKKLFNLNENNNLNNFFIDESTIDIGHLINTNINNSNNNKTNILNAKKIIKNKQERTHNKQNNSDKSNNKFIEFKKNASAKLNKNEENAIAENNFSIANISDFEKTLEENTTLNISKYTHNLKYNKPPEFKHKIRNYLKAPTDDYLDSERRKNNHIPAHTKVLLHNGNKSDNESLENNRNYSLSNHKTNACNSDIIDTDNKIKDSNVNNQINLIDLQSHLSYCRVTNYKDNKNKIFYNEHFNNKTTISCNLFHNNNTINNTLESNNHRLIKFKNDVSLTDNKIKYLTNKNTNNNFNDYSFSKRSKADNSVYIPAAELNNYYIPTYSNADNDELDKQSAFDKSIITANINKSKDQFRCKNLHDYNSQNCKFGNSKENKKYINDTSLNFNKDFILKNSHKINFDNSNFITNNDFCYNNINTENYNFDTISIGINNEHKSESNKWSQNNNETINSKIEKINCKGNFSKQNLIKQPGKMIKQTIERNFHTINFSKSKKTDVYLDNINYTMKNNNYEDNNYYLNQQENNPLENTVSSKISSLIILPKKFLDKNDKNNTKNRNKTNYISTDLGIETIRESRNFICKKKNVIPKYISKQE